MPKKEQPKQAEYFHNAVVEAGGRTYHFSIEDGRVIESRGNHWHGPGDPSSWLIVAVFQEAQRRVGEAGNNVALELTAEALGLTVEKVRSSIEWHEHYMQWHDDDPDYRVL